MTDPGVAEEVSVRYRELFDVSTRKKSEDPRTSRISDLCSLGLAAASRVPLRRLVWSLSRSTVLSVRARAGNPQGSPATDTSARPASLAPRDADRCNLTGAHLQPAASIVTRLLSPFPA